MKKNILLSKSFWITVILSYIGLVIGVWGFVEPYTYFQEDKLKNAVGPYWIAIYLLPIPIAYIIEVVRRKKIPHQQKYKAKPYTTKKNYFKYKSLLWKPTWFGLRLPIPLCPRENCERPVYHEREYPPRYLISVNLQEMQEFLNKQNTYKNVYRCPVHGELREVPDIDIQDLKREARFELKR